MSKINSFALIIIIAISLASCSDKSKDLLNTWRLDNVKFSKPRPQQLIPIIQSQIDYMKSYYHTTYKQDGTEEDVQESRVSKGSWDLSKDGKTLYSTDEMGRTTRFVINELSKDKFTYASVNSPGDTITFFMVPFSAKDTINRKPPPPMMQPRGHAGPPQQQEAPQQDGQAPQQQGNAPAQSAKPAAPKQKQ